MYRAEAAPLVALAEGAGWEGTAVMGALLKQEGT